MTREEKILYLKQRIIEMEKFNGPIARSMIDLIKERIDKLRDEQTPNKSEERMG